MKIIPLIKNKIKVGTYFRTYRGLGHTIYVVKRYKNETYYLTGKGNRDMGQPWSKIRVEELFEEGQWVKLL